MPLAQRSGRDTSDSTQETRRPVLSFEFNDEKKYNGILITFFVKSVSFLAKIMTENNIFFIDMDPLTYLRKFLQISSARQHLFSKIFTKNRLMIEVCAILI